MPHKMVLFITGVPGTGKTQQMRKIIDLFAVKDPFIIQMDRHRVPGKQGAARYKRTDIMLENAIKMGRHIVYENMAISQWVRDNVVTRLHASDYQIVFVLLWTDPEQALMQRIRRRQRTLRWVNPRYVRILEERTPLEFFNTCLCIADHDKAVLLYNTPGAARTLDKVATVTKNRPPRFHGEWNTSEYLKLSQLTSTAREEALNVLGATGIGDISTDAMI